MRPASTGIICKPEIPRLCHHLQDGNVKFGTASILISKILPACGLQSKRYRSVGNKLHKLPFQILPAILNCQLLIIEKGPTEPTIM